MDDAHNDLETIRRFLADLALRVQNIERKLGIEAGQAPARPVLAPPSVSSPAPVPVRENLISQTPTHPPTPATAVPAQPRSKLSQEADLETRIGSHWLNRIGIFAMLIGIAYFLKFAFENNWIGPAARVSIGLLAGIGIVFWSESFRAKGYAAFSYSLKAVGIGAMYLSLWAAFQVYSLLPGAVAFVMMFAVTVAAAAVARVQDAELLAAFALAGGFATPFLLSTGENREVALFAYVLVLDLGTIGLVLIKPWRRLLVMSFAGTLLLYLGWQTRFYVHEELAPTLTFATLFFLVFALSPLMVRQDKEKTGPSRSLPLLAFANAAVYFLEAFVIFGESDRGSMAWFTLALAGLYVFLGLLVRRRAPANHSQTLYYLHLAIALGFITIAVPIRFDTHWVTIAWFVESAVLLWLGDRMRFDLLNVFALGALVLGVVRLLFVDNFHTTQLIFNMRIVTYGVAVAVLGAVAFYARKRQDHTSRSIAAAAIIAINLLVLTAIAYEISDYYSRQFAATSPPFTRWSRVVANEWRRVEIERDFIYSALGMGYGALLMVVGFARRSAFVRWQALILMAITIIKVFIYDVSKLDRGYRIVSFIVLGTLLLAISFVYQRDWLKLSAAKPERSESA
jgi:uncharacterized membrane protein